jgi:hypothetical protein
LLVKGWTLSAFTQNYTIVGDNFARSFLHVNSTPTPRDILIIVDASGSVSEEELRVSSEVS